MKTSLMYLMPFTIALSLFSPTVHADISEGRARELADQHANLHDQQNQHTYFLTDEMVGPAGEKALGFRYSTPSPSENSNCFMVVIVDMADGKILPEAFWGASRTRFSTSRGVECSYYESDFGGGY